MSKYLIPWGGLHLNSFLYGSSVSYENKYQIVYHTNNLPSGTLVHQWFSRTSYYKDKLVPSLPLLIPGQEYRLSLDARAEPEGTAYLRLKFFDLSGTTMAEQYLRQGTLTFTFPEAACNYQIDLLGAGLDKLEFHGLWLESSEEVPDNKQWLWSMTRQRTDIEEWLQGLNPHLPIRLVFLEPHHSLQQAAVHPFMFQSLNAIGISYQEDQWYGEPMYKHLMNLINDLRQLYPSIRFVGYGPYSNWLATYYGTLIQHQGLELSQASFTWQEYASILQQISHPLKPTLEMMKDTASRSKRYGRAFQQSIDLSFTFSRLLDYSPNLIFLSKDGVNYE